MANEFVARKGLIISGSTRASGSITAVSFTGSILGTASQAISSSYVPNLYITASDAPPSAPDINELWYDSTSGKTYIYYRSASVLQWVLQADPTYDPGPSIQDLQDVTDIGSSTTNAITITNTTTAVDSSSGALIVSGGVGVKGALYAATVNANTVTANSFVGTLSGTATTASYVTFANVANKPALVSSSTQFNSLTAPFTGSFTGSFIGSFTGTSSVASNAISSSYAQNADLLDGLNSTVFATTGSNSFVGDQTITGSLRVSGSNIILSSSRVDTSLGNVNNNTTNFGYNVFADAQTAIGYSGYNLQLNNSTANASGYLRLGRTASTVYLGMEIAAASRDGIRFLTDTASPVERIRLTAAGNVGIGVTSPSGLLHVSASGTTNDLLVGDTTTPKLFVSASGNVGIGTTTGTEKLRVAGTFASDAVWTTVSGVTNWGNYPTIYGTLTWNTGLARVHASTGNRLDLGANGSNAHITITGSGDVGIGTSNPTSKLQIQGNVSASSYTSSISNAVGFLGTASWAVTASTVTTNTVSYTAGAGLSGGGSATLGGSSVTIDAVAGAGISLTAPTNDAINIDTGSAHFTGGVKSKLNTDGVVSSSTQFTSLTAPFTGSFTGSFVGAHTGTFPYSSLTGTPTGIISSSGQVTANLPTGTVSSSGQVSYTGLSNVPSGIVSSSGQVSYTGLSNIPVGIVSSSGQISYTGLSNTPVGIVSSSTQFTSLTSPFTGSFTGSFTGALTGTSSWATNSVSSSYALTASYALNGGTGTAGNSFVTFSIAGQTDVVADSSNDTLTLAAGSGIVLTTNPSTDTITIAATAADPQAFNIDTYEFIGDGTTANYNIVNSYSINSLLVSVDGLTYMPSDDYTLSTNTLSFITSPPSQSNILVRAFVNATTGVTGSFTGSFFGTFFATASQALTASLATTASFAISASWAPGGAGTVTSITAGDGLSGGTITNSGTVSLNTASIHFVTGSIGVLNSKNVISSSAQVNYSSLQNKPTIKAGSIANTSFVGTPRKASVIFSTGFSNTNYAVTITGEDARSWTIEGKVTAGFTASANSNTALTGTTYWIATAYGET